MIQTIHYHNKGEEITLVIHVFTPCEDGFTVFEIKENTHKQVLIELNKIISFYFQTYFESIIEFYKTTSQYEPLLKAHEQCLNMNKCKDVGKLIYDNKGLLFDAYKEFNFKGDRGLKKIMFYNYISLINSIIKTTKENGRNLYSY